MAKHDNKALVVLATTLGTESKSKAETATTAKAFVEAGLAFGESKPAAADIDAACVAASESYRKAAGVPADDKVLKKVLSHLRGYIALGAMEFDNQTGTQVAADIMKAAGEKVKVLDHVTGEEKERNRITGGVRETIYSASVYLKKHHADGLALKDGWDALLEHLEPSDDTAEKALGRAHKAVAAVLGLATDAEIDGLSQADAATIAAFYDLASRNPFKQAKAPAANARLDALRARSK